MSLECSVSLGSLHSKADLIRYEGSSFQVRRNETVRPETKAGGFRRFLYVATIQVLFHVFEAFLVGQRRCLADAILGPYGQHPP